MESNPEIEAMGKGGEGDAPLAPEQIEALKGGSDARA